MADASRAEVDFYNGYERGRGLILTKGTAAVEQWFRDHARDKNAFYEGVVQALCDWEDANGVPHSPVAQRQVDRRGREAG